MDTHCTRVEVSVTATKTLATLNMRRATRASRVLEEMAEKNIEAMATVSSMAISKPPTSLVVDESPIMVG